MYNVAFMLKERAMNVQYLTGFILFYFRKLSLSYHLNNTIVLARLLI